MDINFFTTNLDNPARLIPEIQKEHRSCYKFDAFQQYYPTEHKVNKLEHRPKKMVDKPDPSGARKAGTTEPAVITVWEEVNRIAIPMQKLITSRKTAFLTGGVLTLKAKANEQFEKDMLQFINEVWRKNKMQYNNSRIAKAVYSETEAAEIWYTKINKDGTKELRCNVYTPSQGYALMPVFDNHKDLIAFALGYETVELGVITQHLDLYTKDELRRHTTGRGRNWELVPSTPEQANPFPLTYGKIPVIYYQQPQSCWADVQPMIDRLETVFSNFGDTNDYNGSPILFIEGTITGFAEKGERGKVLQGTGGAKASYVSWDQAPEAIKLELTSLVDYIFTQTQSPNISFEAMRGLGDISGVAFDRLMIDAHLAAKDAQNGWYGEGIQRRCNFLLAALSAIDPRLKKAIDMEITPAYGLYRIDDEAAKIELAMKAAGGKRVATQLMAITMAGVSDDPEQTLKDIEAEDEAAAKREQPIDPNEPTPPVE